MAGSTPLQQWRKAGRWPQRLDLIWRRLEERHGVNGATREMIALVRVGLGEGWERLTRAVEEALRLGVSDAAAEELAQFERPMPVMDEYDLLLSGKGTIQ